MSDSEEVEEGDSEEKGQIVPHEAYVMKLSYPVKFGERMVEELVFKPLKGKMMRRAKTGPDELINWSVELGGIMSGEVTQVFDLMEGCDIMEVVRVVGVFFQASRKPGPK